MTLEYLIGQLAGGVCDASILGQIPIFNVLAQDKATEFGEKLSRYFQNYEFHIRKKAVDIMTHVSEENRNFVVDAAIDCFGMIDAENILKETHYDARMLSREKAENYLKKQKDLGDKYESLLKTYLAPLVEAAVRELQRRLVEQSEYINQAIGTHHESLADLSNRVGAVEARSSVPVNPADLVADISEELKYLWNDYPFLERHRKNRKKALSEFYKLPFGELSEDDEPEDDEFEHYESNDDKPGVNIHERLQEAIDSGNDHRKRMLVLMGVPGSGKTTVITYLLNKLKIDRTVRVYRFSDFTNMNTTNWTGALLAGTGLEQENLSNSVLILDGLDELDLHNQYDQFVEKLRRAWANNDDITNFTLILTCRTNRLHPNALRCNYVILAPLSEQQISEFATDYLGECPPKLKNHLDENQGLCNVLGIPILLYMVLGLGLTIDSSTSVAGLYDEIFSLDGDNSIYKRCYDRQQHPITEKLKEKIHQFSQGVAATMFYREDVHEELDKSSYIRLAKEVIGNHSNYNHEDLLIGQYFLLGYKEEKIYFVHRSIFEYFVALSILNALTGLAKTNKVPEELYQEMEPGKSCHLTTLATLLSPHHLTEFPEIKGFLRHLIQANLEELSSFSNWDKLAKLIFENGLADAVPNRPHGGEQGLKEEAYRFLNLLDICRCILPQTRSKPFDLIPESYHESRRSSYWGLLYRVPYADLSFLNLSRANLSRADLRQADLRQADLYGADLSGANLCGANLFRADLSWVDLSWTSLTSANLTEAVLYMAQLSRAVLFIANLSMADLTGADLSGAELSGADLFGAELFGTVLYRTTLPDKRKYEDAPEQDGEDVMLQFADPERWNELHPDKAVDPDRFRGKGNYDL